MKCEHDSIKSIKNSDEHFRRKSLLKLDQKFWNLPRETKNVRELQYKIIIFQSRESNHLFQKKTHIFFSKTN